MAIAEPIEETTYRDPHELPGPRGTWGAIKTILKYFYESHGLHDYVRTYGETVFADSVFGPCLYTSDPALVKKLFTTPTSAFISFSDVYKCLLGDNSVVLMEGDRHLTQRKLMMPMFHGETLKIYGASMRGAAQQRYETWEVGQTYKMQREMGDIALKIIIGTVLGAIEPERVRLYTEAIREMGHAIWAPGLYLKSLRKMPFGLGPWAKFMRCVEHFHSLVWEDMRARREGGLRTPDVLSELLYATYEDGTQMSYEAVRDEVSGLLMAGYDTVSVSLTWALHDLHMNPEVLARLQADVDSLPEHPTLDDYNALPFLEAVAMETLRMHPPSFETTRRLRQPMVLDGYLFPENTGIVIGIMPIHFRPEIYPEPHTYRPERFLERKYAPHEFLTFGGGTRRCIGSALTLYGMKIAIASVLREWQLELLEPGPVRTVRGDPGLQAENGIPMRVVARRKIVPAAAPVAAPSGGSGCPFHHA